jgi:hypothetical protein
MRTSVHFGRQKINLAAVPRQRRRNGFTGEQWRRAATICVSCTKSTPQQVVDTIQGVRCGDRGGSDEKQGAMGTLVFGLLPRS